MENKKLTENELKKLFPKKEELEFKRREVKKKEVPVGCKTHGMIFKSEQEPCEDPRCGTCKKREAADLKKSLEDKAWSDRRKRRRVQGFSLGTFETEEKLLNYSEELKRGNYAYVGTTFYRFCGKEWKAVENK